MKFCGLLVINLWWFYFRCKLWVAISLDYIYKTLLLKLGTRYWNGFFWNFSKKV